MEDRGLTNKEKNCFSGSIKGTVLDRNSVTIDKTKIALFTRT